MSHKVINNQVTLTRGDTFITTVELARGTTPYEPQQGDKIAFKLKRAIMNPTKTAYVDKTPLITKDIPIATRVLRIDPEDTKNLAFGDYVYDIEVTFADGRVDTVITSEQFVIGPEVD